MEKELVQMFGLFHDGGNCWARGSARPNWYWAKSWADEGETRAEFMKRLKRMGLSKARQNYYDYVDCKTWGAKVFSDVNKFLAAARKVGLNPNLND